MNKATKAKTHTQRKQKKTKAGIKKYCKKENKMFRSLSKV